MSCDAVQVYRGLDAASAKPTLAERRRVAHHLIDVAEPGVDFTLADYVRLATRAVREVAARGRVPAVVGGTGMYLRGLLRGIIPAPARDEALRARLGGMVSRHGTPRMHRWLNRLDADSAARIPPGDARRIVRALEIALSGEASWSQRIRREGTWSGATERFATLKVGLDMDREALKQRLRRRVDAFFNAGLVDEVRALRSRGVSHDANAFKAIGYREVLGALTEGRDPDSVREEVYRRTRDYSKRQRTWFRKERDVVWLDASAGPDGLAREIEGMWHSRRERV